MEKSAKEKQFRAELKSFLNEKKRNFEWRKTRDPYKILVSEMMLQQTHVERVAGKYRTFVKRFPDPCILSKSSQKTVLRFWIGLGYNRRAFMLHRTAGEICKIYGGKFPKNEKLLRTFPGIGSSTAGAILAFAFNMKSVFLETNIRRVLIHHFFEKRKNISDKEILSVLEILLRKEKDFRSFYYALMDYGSWLGKNMKENPNKRSIRYKTQGKFRGSTRELRGKIVKMIVSGIRLDVRNIERETGFPRKKIKETLFKMKKDGFLKK